MKIYLLIIIFIFLLVTRPILGQSKIFINEFLIDPQPQSVEIFNSGTESADISDWIIDDSGGTTFFAVPKDSVVFPNQCLVFSGDFNLNKTSPDTVRLINSSQQLIDSFSYKSSSGSGVSFYRLSDNDNYWTTGSANLGFYNSNTEQTCLFPTLTPTPTLIQPTPTDSTYLTNSPTPTIAPTIGTEDPSPTEIPVPQSYDNVYLSEVMVNSMTGEKEWVEIYNDNDFSVSLNNWYVDDLENAGSSPKIFSLEINAKGYGVFDLNSSIFNNDGDSVRLLDYNKELKDDFEYSKTEQGKTLGRIRLDSDDFCLQEPSKNSVNNPCINPSPTPQPAPTITTSAKTGKTNLSSTSTNFAVPRSINYPTGVIQKNYDNGDVLGLTNDLIINSPSNKSLTNLLTILSISYSLLTIITILFKMKLSYGKNKNFYSPPFHSS